jgi:LacI family transcriptional regulator
MKTTIKEVALEAGVSIATVSRVLNGKDRVKSSTRKKVEQTIEKLNFFTDQNARNMIKKETRTIGMIIPHLSNEYWSQLFDVLQANFWLKGYTLFVGSTDLSLEKERAFIKSFIERRVDGIIFGSSLAQSINDKMTFEMIRKYGIPIVSLDPNMREMNCVLGDHLQGSTDAVHHLIQLGHRNIAFIGGPNFPDSRELGFRNAFMQNGLFVKESFIRRTDSSPSFQCGYQEALKLFEAHKGEFSAIFCYNDATAFGVLKALEEKGMRVPQDIAIVGYDDVQMAGIFKPALTTVRQPIREVGEALANLLIESIETPPNDSMVRSPKSISFKMQLIVRESCGSGLKT